MRKLLLLPLMALLFVSCSEDSVLKLKEKVKSSLSEKVPTVVATQLECTGLAAIKADVDAALEKVSFLKTDETVGSTSLSGGDALVLLCKTAATSLVPLLLDQGVPADWNCELTKVEDAAVKLAGLGCDKLSQ